VVTLLNAKVVIVVIVVIRLQYLMETKKIPLFVYF